MSALTWRCRACLTDNAPEAAQCQSCGAALHRVSANSVAAPPPVRGHRLALATGALLLLGAGVLVGLWLACGEPAPAPWPERPVEAAPPVARADPATHELVPQPDLPPSFAVLQVKHPRYEAFKIPAVVVGQPPRLLASLGQLMGCTEITPVWPEGVQITGVAGASEEHGFVLFAVHSERTLRPLRVGAFQLPQGVDIVAFRGVDPPRGVQATQLSADERGRRFVVFQPPVAAPAVALSQDLVVALVVEDGKGLPLDQLGPFLERPTALTLAEFRAQFFARDPDYLLAEGLAAERAGRNEDAVRLLLAALAADATLRPRILVPLESACSQAGREHLGRGDAQGALDLVQNVLPALPDRPALLALAVDACLRAGRLTQALPLWRRLPRGAGREQEQARMIELVHQRAALAIERNQPSDALALLESFVAEFPDHPVLLLDAARARALLGQISEALAAAERALAADPSLQREVAALREALTVQGVDSLRIPIERDSRSIVTTLNVSGHNLECLVDTGASMTTVPVALAQTLGLLRPGLATMKVETAGGVVDGQIVVLPQVRLGGFELRSLRALVLELPGGLAGKGLIGLNLLHRFDFHVDQDAGVLVLERKRGRR